MRKNKEDSRYRSGFFFGTYVAFPADRTGARSNFLIYSLCRFAHLFQEGLMLSGIGTDLLLS